MQLGELGRRDTSKAAVRPNLVVVVAPFGNDGTRLWQRLEPVLVEALVAEFAVEVMLPPYSRTRSSRNVAPVPLPDPGAPVQLCAA